MAVPTIRRLLDEQPLLDEIERMYDVVRNRAFQLFRDNDGRSSIENWLQAEREMFWKPPVALVAKNQTYVVQTAVPGLDAGDIDVRVIKGRLVIKAEKAHEHSERDEKVLRCESNWRRIFREVELPQDADIDSGSATLDKGLLTLTFSRVAAPTRKIPLSKIPVQVGA